MLCMGSESSIVVREELHAYYVSKHTINITIAFHNSIPLILDSQWLQWWGLAHVNKDSKSALPVSVQVLRQLVFSVQYPDIGLVWRPCWRLIHSSRIERVSVHLVSCSVAWGWAMLNHHLMMVMCMQLLHVLHRHSLLRLAPQCHAFI